MNKDTQPVTPSREAALEARARLLEGFAVSESVVEAAGVHTTVVEGGGGPPLVLLHGQGASALAWLPVLRDLMETHTVIVPDLPGLGESTVAGGELSTERAVAWLEDLVEARCTESPSVVGLSLGGSFAAHLAVRSRQPLDRVVLADSGSLAPFRPDPRVVPALVRLSAKPDARRLERFFRKVVVDLDRARQGWGGRWGDFVTYGLERAATPSVKSANGAWLRRVGTKRISEADLAKVDVPVSLIWGTRDRVMKPRIARWATARFGWPLHMLEDCGHVSCWDQPEAFVEAVRAPS